MTANEMQRLVHELDWGRNPWWWRIRRQLAYACLDRGWPRLGYLIDVDRDRHDDD